MNSLLFALPHRLLLLRQLHRKDPWPPELLTAVLPLHPPLLLLQPLRPQISPITLVDPLTTLKSLAYVQYQPNPTLSEPVNLLPQLQQIDSFRVRPTTLLSKISILIPIKDHLSTPPLPLQQVSIISPEDPLLRMSTSSISPRLQIFQMERELQLLPSQEEKRRLYPRIDQLRRRSSGRA